MTTIQTHQYLAGKHLEEGEEVVAIAKIFEQVATTPTSLRIWRVRTRSHI